MGLTDFITAFLLGLATPLTAVCVLPLYPAFLSFLASQFDRKDDGLGVEEPVSKKNYALLGLFITLGILVFMLILGVLFTTILQESLTSVIGIVSPIAFGILGVISILLIIDFDYSKIFKKKINSPTTKNPLLTAFLYGLFFGAIVIPCNPAFIAAFFSRAILFTNFISSILNFLFFGLGLGFPLLLFSLLSFQKSSAIINWLSLRKRVINLVAGLIMLGISVYYLVVVFKVLG